MNRGLTVLLITLITIVCFSSVAGAALQDGLIVHYPFDETTGTTAADASGNDNDAVLLNGASWVPNGGKIGGALKISGTADKKDCAMDEKGKNYIDGLTAFTVALWIKSDKTGTDSGFIYNRWPGDGQDNGLTIRYDKAGFNGRGTNVIKAAISAKDGAETHTRDYESASNVQTKEWQHIVMTWRSGNQIALYINGVKDIPTHNASAVTGTITGSTRFMIGRSSKDARNSWDGLIDDVRLYNRPLTQAEITTLASGAITDAPVSTEGVQLAGVGDLTSQLPSGSGDAIYTVRITNTGNTSDTINLTTSGDVAATLSRSSVTLAAGASTDVTITIPGAVLTTPGRYEVTVKATSGSDNTITDAITTTTTITRISVGPLIGYWNFDEGMGNVAMDISGNGNHLTKDGAADHIPWAPTADARIGNSAFYNSNSGKRVYFFTEDVDFINGLSQFSLALWVKSPWASTDRGFVVGKVAEGNDSFFNFRYDDAGFQGGGDDVIKAGITTTEGAHLIETSNMSTSTEWQHLVFTWRSGETMKVYIDGELDTLSYSDPVIAGMITEVARFSIGRGSKTTDSKGWVGYIDDVRLYDRPLTQAEIMTLASAGTTVDPVSTGNFQLAGVGNLTTELPSGSGDAVYTVRITNTGTALDTINLTTSGDVAATLSRSSVSLAAGASTDVILTIDEDAITEVGEYEVTVTATSQTDSTQTASVTTQTTIFTCGVELAGVGDLTKTLTDASEGVSYTIRVSNTGSRSDTVTLTTSGDVAATLSPTSVSLAAGASEDVTLTIAADALADAGTYKVTVTATPGSDSTKTAEVTTETTIKLAFAITLTGVEGVTTETTDAGNNVHWTIRATNTGNSSTAVLLAASGDVAVTLDKTIVPLVQNASSDAKITITEETLATLLTTPGDYQVKIIATLALSSTILAEITSTLTIAQLPWDINSDGTVNIQDLVKVASTFGESGDGIAADVNGDGTVDIRDLVQVASNFGAMQAAYALNNLSVSYE